MNKKLDAQNIRRHLARRTLAHFATYTDSHYQLNWHHALLCGYLDRFVAKEIRRLMVFMPPRHGKSELVSRKLPAFIFGHDPDASIIATSYSADLAQRMNRDVQRIIDSEAYGEIFPQTSLFGKNIRTVASGSYLRNSDIFEVVGYRGSYRSAGVGGGITGMGGDYIIIDDPIKNREEANSLTYRNKLWDWYTSTLYTRQEKDAAILVTLTRWHEDDLAGRLLEAAKPLDGDQWEIISLPAIRENDTCPYDLRDEGVPLWEDKYNAKSLAVIKATVGGYDWNALYQQRPSPQGGNIFKREWWKFYTVLPQKFDKIVQSWDFTFKEADTSDFVVGQIWGKIGADCYLIDQWRDRADFVKSVEAIKKMTTKYPQARQKLIEDKANGSAIISALKREMSGLVPVMPIGSKEARAYAVTPEIESGNVYLPSPSIASWINDFIEEYSAFPNGANDDQVDCGTQALNKLYAPSGMSVLKPKTAR